MLSLNQVTASYQVYIQGICNWSASGSSYILRNFFANLASVCTKMSWRVTYRDKNTGEQLQRAAAASVAVLISQRYGSVCH